MSKVSTQFNDYLSLAVMLLMFAALLGSQANTAASAADDTWSTEPAGIISEHLKDGVLELGIVVTSELRQFRGEDE